MIKKVLAVFGLLILGFLLWNINHVIYGVRQLKGQLNIILNSVPVEEYLEDPEAPDSLKQKLILIQEVRNFAIESLGINDSDNYTTLFDQEGKPVLWVISACKPFALEPKLWKFPFLGSFPYKGYFNYELALKEKQKLDPEWDTRIRTVTGWSTLGWAKDPIMSNMLLRDEGSLAELIIHELTHATLYVKDSVEFNENLASFIGEQGAIEFLKYKHGKPSEPLQKYLDLKQDNYKFYDHFLSGALSLDSLYDTFDEAMSDAVKRSQKEMAIKKIINSFDTITFKLKNDSGPLKLKELPNNAYFMSFRRYRSKIKAIEQEFRQDFGEDIKRYITVLKERYPSL